MRFLAKTRRHVTFSIVGVQNYGLLQILINAKRIFFLYHDVNVDISWWINW